MYKLTSQATITALILSGGQGSRLDGQDKGLVEFQGKPLIAHTIEILSEQVEQIIISINRNQDSYEALGYPTVVDMEHGEYNGPIAGILAAKSKIDTKLMLVTPCDTPKLPADYIDRMTEALIKNQSEVVVAHDGERQQNLHLLMQTKCLDSLELFFESGGRAIKDWLVDVDTSQVDFSAETKRFDNINTREQISG